MFVNKNHPALKHGGYSTTTILPTESVAEFEELHKDLISELEPNGALADDIVATITRMVWKSEGCSCRLYHGHASGIFSNASGTNFSA
jgi:hypothetical protein